MPPNALSLYNGLFVAFVLLCGMEVLIVPDDRVIGINHFKGVFVVLADTGCCLTFWFVSMCGGFLFLRDVDRDFEDCMLEFFAILKKRSLSPLFLNAHICVHHSMLSFKEMVHTKFKKRVKEHKRYSEKCQFFCQYNESHWGSMLPVVSQTFLKLYILVLGQLWWTNYIEWRITILHIYNQYEA